MNNDDVDKIGAPFFNKERKKTMRVAKSQGVLYIFNLLLKNKYIIKENIMNDLEITELTFWRYIQEIRAFIFNFNLSYELKYDRNEEKYYLE